LNALSIASYYYFLIISSLSFYLSFFGSGFCFS